MSSKTRGADEKWGPGRDLLMKVHSNARAAPACLSRHKEKGHTVAGSERAGRGIRCEIYRTLLLLHLHAGGVTRATRARGRFCKGGTPGHTSLASRPDCPLSRAGTAGKVPDGPV